MKPSTLHQKNRSEAKRNLFASACRQQNLIDYSADHCLRRPHNLSSSIGSTSIIILTTIMKFLITASLLIPATTGFTFPTTTTPARHSTFLQVSQSSKTDAKNLAKDFDDTSPEDVTPSSSGAKVGQAEVVLVGCGAPNRGMGWYHAVQMLEGR